MSTISKDIFVQAIYDNFTVSWFIWSQNIFKLYEDYANREVYKSMLILFTMGLYRSRCVVRHSRYHVHNIG